MTSPDRRTPEPTPATPDPTTGPHPLVVAAAGLLAVAGTAYLDLVTGPYLSFGVFYLLPVAVAAWFGGFAHGILVATCGAAAWGAVDLSESPGGPPAAVIWNGIARFATLALVASLTARVRGGIARERQLARTDALTGAANGRCFYEAAAAEVARAGRPVTLAYLDLDDFKQVNDRLGHAAGDEVLTVVARTVQAAVGPAGLLGRLGGDEFGLLLPGFHPGEAAALLVGLHRRLTDEVRGRGWPVGVSVGAVTFLRPDGDVDELVRKADGLMYAAKRDGKGQVRHCVADEADGAEPGHDSRRATARVLDGRPARVRREGEDGGEFAAVRDVFADRVSLRLEKSFAPGTVLVVEPLSPRRPTLLVRVAGVDVESGGWVHRCTLSHHLSDDDLRGWLTAGKGDSQVRDGLQSDKETVVA